MAVATVAEGKAVATVEEGKEAAMVAAAMAVATVVAAKAVATVEEEKEADQSDFTGHPLWLGSARHPAATLVGRGSSTASMCRCRNLHERGVQGLCAFLGALGREAPFGGVTCHGIDPRGVQYTAIP